ncbi:MAG: hypothetical protein OEY59_09665 [Deltaproteobacteria bacterium]|nr:hypothetical protein [Deltaproteobacteria bacterium]
MLTGIKKKGWEISSARKLSESKPALFGVFEEEKRSSLKPGDWAKLKMKFFLGNSTTSAYIWVQVEKRTEKAYQGKINFAKSLTPYITKLGNVIDFTPEHIIQIVEAERSV